MKNKKWFVVILAAVTVLCVMLALTACNDETPEHTYGNWIAEVPASCTQAGTKAHYHCSDCGKYFDADKNEVTAESLVIPKLGHNYGELIGEVDSTCAQAGMEAHYYCEVCHTYFDAEQNETTEQDLAIAPKQHKLEKVDGEDATCTDDGVIAHWHCETCGNDYADENGTTLLEETVIHSTGHNYGELVQKQDETCEEDGMEAHFYCDVCETYFDAQKVETTADDLKINKKGHAPREVAQEEATCTDDGVKAHWHCDNCGKNYKDQACSELMEDVVITKLGHDVDTSAVNVTKVPSFEEEGSFTTGACKRNCGYTGGNGTLPTLDDENYEITGNTATCTAGGTGHYTIEVNSVTVQFDADTAARGHNYGELIGKQDATCEDEGMEEHYYCDKCQTYFDAEKVETTKQALTIEALGHEYGELIGKQDATCTEAGMKAYYYCEVCQTYFDAEQHKTTEQELVINALGHNTAQVNGQDATCDEDGVVAHWHCDRCDKNFQDQEGEQLIEEVVIEGGHDFENHACKNCDYNTIQSKSGADIVEEDGKVYFIISGTFTGKANEALENDLKAIPFDLQENSNVANNNEGDWSRQVKHEIACEQVKFDNDGKTWKMYYDVTTLEPYAYQAHFGVGDDGAGERDLKLEPDAAQDGKPVKLNGIEYTLVNRWGQEGVMNYWGCVGLRIIDTRTYEITGATIETDEQANKVYFVISGTYNGYSSDELKAVLNSIYFDFQQRGGGWTRHKDLARTISAEDGVWTLKLDVTTIPVDGNPYTGHLGGETVDLKLDADKAQDGYEVIFGGRIYTIVNKVGSKDESDNWGCVSLKVEDATTLNVTGATLETGEDGKVYLVLDAIIRNYNLNENVITVGDGSDVHGVSKHESTGKDSYKLYFDVTERAANGKALWCHLYIDGQVSTYSHEGNVYVGDTMNMSTSEKIYRLRRDEGTYWILQLFVEQSDAKVFTFIRAKIEQDNDKVYMVYKVNFAGYTADELKTFVFFDGDKRLAIDEGKTVIGNGEARLYIDITNVEANGSWWYGHYEINGEDKGDLYSDIDGENDQSVIRIGNTEYKITKANWGQLYLVVYHV